MEVRWEAGQTGIEGACSVNSRMAARKQAPDQTQGRRHGDKELELGALETEICRWGEARVWDKEGVGDRRLQDWSYSQGTPFTESPSSPTRSSAEGKEGEMKASEQTSKLSKNSSPWC